MSVSSATAIGGASPDHKRNAGDFYVTPRACTEALIKECPWFLDGQVWEPACGDGAIAKIIPRTVASDLEDRGYGMAYVDFLKCNAPWGDSIITNPPFNLAEEFIEHSRSMGVPFAMLLKATFWHAARRRVLFQETGPKFHLPMTWRPNMDPSRGNSGTMDFAWTVWGATPSPICTFKLLGRV